MYIKQLYTGCLSEAAYYIESEGKAAIIDPLRDIDGYLRLANEREACIEYIFETHFHADFVSGHVELSQATGAPIVYGPGTQTNFPIHVAKDKEEFKLGKLVIEVLHTPGHTLESSCFLLRDEKGSPHALFTGDTLFIGDVGRPDLAQKGEEITREDLAGMLYDSIQQKIITLPDNVIIYPAHGAGSSCGKNLGPETFSTIGEQKLHNYALKADSRKEFINSVLDGLTDPPQYFPINAKINKEGYESLHNILVRALKPYTPEALKIASSDHIILDTRSATVFTQGFVPGSISIGLEGRFAEWAGSLLPFDAPILLVTDPGKENESVVRLARVGFDKIHGYLDGGVKAWEEAGESLDMIIDIEADELAMDLPYDDHLVVIDVRRETEFADGHIRGALNLPVQDLTDPASMAMLSEKQNLYLHCAGGYRSVIAASLLKRQGFHNIRNILGGWNKIQELQKIEIIKETSVLN